MKFYMELPGVLHTMLPTRDEEHGILLSLALEKPSITIKGERREGKTSLELACNCPDGEKQALREARRLSHIVEVEVSFKKNEPTTPFSCRVCRPALTLATMSLARGAPRPLEEVEVLLSFGDSIVLRTVIQGGASAYLHPEPEPDPPASPWLVYYWLPPPGLRVVIARLPHASPAGGGDGDRVLKYLGVLFRMLWEDEVLSLPMVLGKLAEALGWGAGGLPLFPVGGEEGWFWVPLPSPEECSRDLIEYRERLAGFLEENASERMVTRLSPGGVVEVL